MSPIELTASSSAASGASGSQPTDPDQSVIAPPDDTLARLRRGVVAVVLAMAVLTAVRLSFITGLWTPVMIDGPSMAPALRGVRYEVACADCRFVFSRDAEAGEPGLAACPNCGFVDPIASLNLRRGDRVLIDRWPHLWSQPHRGEIVAARQGGASGELIVKRIAAIGPAELSIRDGDLFQDGQIVRKSLHELRELRQLVHDNDHQPPARSGLPPRWQSVADDSVWQAAGTEFHARPSAPGGSFDWLEYHHWMCTGMPRARSQATAVRDYDPYNAGEREMNVVRDLALTCRVRAQGEGRFALALSDGLDRFEAVFEPGRRVVIRRGDQQFAETALQWNFARRPVEVEFGLCDQQVLLSVAGRTLVRQAYDRPDGPHRDVLSPLAIGTDGPALEVSRLRVWRDIYYLEPRKTAREWSAQRPLPEGHFLLLGDNQPASHDGRSWEIGVPRSAIVGRVYRAFW